ncbi:MAG: HD domain-containing protein [Hydrogenoanaerobacterium sp.]
MDSYEKMQYRSKGKIIRDAVHGDIFILNRFLKVIDTPEFQRLRRIKQLSVANIVFPSADHTRFSHSIGCFFVMEKIIIHFETIFAKIGIPISQEDKDIALLAALLHDIGHGPFSHAFEEIHPKAEKNISHEDWTALIITAKDGAVRKQIENEFGVGVPQKVADLIQKQRSAKNETKTALEKIDLFSVLSSLISSQLDADRLDYLVRDAFHTGVPFGRIDISRIITALSITVYQNKYYVCVPEKFIDDIEAYLLARYHMQSAVYFHNLKVQMEQIIHQIFRRAYELFQKNKLMYCPQAIKTYFSEDEVTVKDYIRLDDSTFWCAFQDWADLPDKCDEQLSSLCKTILNREKATKVDVLDHSDEAYRSFKRDICELFTRYGHKLNEEKLENSYFWIEQLNEFSAYKQKKENIWIQKSNGLVVDLAECSKIVHQDDKKPVFMSEQHIIWINYNVLKKLAIPFTDDLISDLQKLINNYDIRHNIEIEKKYHFSDNKIFEDVLSYLLLQEQYKCECGNPKEQIDYYYDTSEHMLNEIGSTLRVREKCGRYEITIKTKTPVSTEDNGQNERFEFQHEIKENSLIGQEDFIVKHLPKIIENKDELAIKMSIKNKRKPTVIKDKNAIFEMVFDDLTYINANGNEAKDYQIEIELKSDYVHRVNLKMLTDDLENKVHGLVSSSQSKYERGLELTSY